MIKIEWLTFREDVPASGMWDQAFLKDILDSLDKYDSDRAVCVIAGAGNKDEFEKINAHLAKHKKVLVIITSDEESLFDSDNLEHDDMIVYSQYPIEGKSTNVDFWLPIGYTPHIRPTLKEVGLQEKEFDWFFSGQITHESREKLYEQLKDFEGGLLLGTAGFTQGMKPEEYGANLAKAKVVPSPSGAIKPEAFRTYESLEAGALPLPQGEKYHKEILEDSAFPYSKDWENVREDIKNYARQFPKVNNYAQSWWLQQKRRIRQRFIDDLELDVSPITVLVSTSPVVTNPSTVVLETVIDSIRNQLPEAEILIMCDGVRKEQKKMDLAYQEYLRRVIWKCNLEWENITPIVYKEHLHQLEMTRQTLPKVNTELVLFVEHDMPFYNRPIDWENTAKLVQSDKIKVMRYHFEAVIPEPHYYLMLDSEPITVDEVPLIRTAQWSQRPHLIKKDFYIELLDKFGSKKANCMIEDAIHGHIVDDVLERDMWDDYRIAIYAPAIGYCFAYHIDGRQGEEKYEGKQVF